MFWVSLQNRPICHRRSRNAAYSMPTSSSGLSFGYRAELLELNLGTVKPSLSPGDLPRIWLFAAFWQLPCTRRVCKSKMQTAPWESWQQPLAWNKLSWNVTQLLFPGYLGMGAPFGESDVELLQNQWNINVKSVEVNIQNGTSACGWWLAARAETERFVWSTGAIPSRTRLNFILAT